MIDLTKLFQAAIELVAALIMAFLIPFIKAHTTKTQQQTMRAMVKSLVYAAEQLYGDGKGEEKLQYVKGRLQEKGYDVDTDEIEAAVYDYLNSDKLLGSVVEIQPDAE